MCNLLEEDRDMNNVVIGNKDTNPRGESVLDFILKYNPQMWKRGSTPIFQFFSPPFKPLDKVPILFPIMFNVMTYYSFGHLIFSR